MRADESYYTSIVYCKNSYKPAMNCKKLPNVALLNRQGDPDHQQG